MIVPRDYPNAQLSVSTERSKGRSEGVQIVRNACLTLNSTSPPVIRSVVVLVSLDDLPVGPSSAIDLAQRIADEYGLAADAHISRYRRVARVHQLDPIVTVGGRRPRTLADAVKVFTRVFLGARPRSPNDPDRTIRPIEGTR